MGRIGITQADVYNAAQAIAEAGDFPTIQSVHAKLGRGSLGTIHKHLLAWKQERLLAPAIKFEVSKDATKVKHLIHEKQNLEKTVQRQIEQNVAMSSQLLDLEQENIGLKSKLSVSLEQIQSLSAENTRLINKVSAHDDLLKQLKASHVDAINIILSDKNAEIESLKIELKTVHLASIEMVRKTSFEGQDLLMLERVKTINLNDQVKALNAKIHHLEQKLEAGVRLDSDNGNFQKNNKVLKSYTLDEIYAQKGLDKKDSDEDVA